MNTQSGLQRMIEQNTEQNIKQKIEQRHPLICFLEEHNFYKEERLSDVETLVRLLIEFYFISHDDSRTQKFLQERIYGWDKEIEHILISYLEGEEKEEFHKLIMKKEEDLPF